MDRIDESQLKAAPTPAPARAVKGKRNRWKRSAVALAVAVALGAGGYFGWAAWNGDSAGAATYTAAVVQRGDLEDTVTATGILQPRDFVDVGTQVSGQVRKLHV
ncbi:MAG: hypothetical protein V4637_15630, partial [Pseudomonadota bacterium]